MYAKLINGALLEAPYNIKRGETDIFGYNLPENESMLLEDGYKHVVRADYPEGLRQPVKTYREEPDRIVEEWVDGYVEPVLTYADKRAENYPDPREYLDAQVKINSGDAALVAEGQKQLQNYVNKCLAIKAEFPKLITHTEVDNV